MLICFELFEKNMGQRFYYSALISELIEQPTDLILGRLARNNEFDLEPNQRQAWIEQIGILKSSLRGFDGILYFEYSIPRMGRRIDVICIIESVLFILEFKVGEKGFPSYAIDQVMDYALDMKNFHETSHQVSIVPILISTNATVPSDQTIDFRPYHDKIFKPVKSNSQSLPGTLRQFVEFVREPKIEFLTWQVGIYKPTPTIIEAARALYNGHSVEDITKKEAEAKNLAQTTRAIDQIIQSSRDHKRKSICFVTGVPGAGKTLIGLDVATKYHDQNTDLHSVFLSGNGPLVDVLREALALDKVKIEENAGKKVKKGQARSEVKVFIQNVHHFRDDALHDLFKPPLEHVALFDEAQRAWNIEKTADFMKRKKGFPNFSQSEPEFLISCMDRHHDWAVIVCLVGGGQEIHDGEAGIGEWLRALDRTFQGWDIYISPQLNDSEYKAQEEIIHFKQLSNIHFLPDLHLSVSMRSFRAEHLSGLVKQVLDFDVDNAQETLQSLRKKYPIILTRDLKKAKQWLRDTARGSERFGLVVSSQASRLKPLAVDVRVNIDPIHWFLNDKNDTRSSYFLEDVATEFQIQGLELDWTCVIWDADFRYSSQGWDYKSFKGCSWQKINKPINQQYLKNAYRVLLTRARQGMVIVVPEGDEADPTRLPEFYDPTYKYLNGIGFETL